MTNPIYTSGDVLRGISERVMYYEDRWGMIIHGLHIEDDEVVIDYTLPSGEQFIDSHVEVLPHD